MADDKPRDHLVLGHKTLREGARIHDMIEFSRAELGKNYAENTRESIRKSSCKQLVDHGLAIANPDDPARSTNSGNWHYVLAEDLLSILDCMDTSQREKMAAAWLAHRPDFDQEELALDDIHSHTVKLPEGKAITLSPGMHNALVKMILEGFLPRFVEEPRTLYVGDTRNKMLHIDEPLCRELGIQLGVHEKLPDLLVYSEKQKRVFAIEAVTSVGPITDLRRREIAELLGASTKTVFVTAFPRKQDFKKFADQLGWGTIVWIAEEPEHVIRFNGHIP
jgi:adenine-specific DNA-methyltransferase